jgi:hypothetical protein
MKSPRRWLALGLALAAAAALAMSVWVGSWWSVGEVTVGPFGARACFGGECRLRGLAWLDGGDLWLRGAIATGVAGVIASFLAAAVAGGLAAKRVPRMLARSLLAACATALVVGAYFAIGFPGIGGAETHIGFCLPLYGVGIALAVAAAVFVVRMPRVTP